MTNYHAYLVRLWRENEHQPWRAELVSPHMGEKHRFATVMQLYAFIDQQLQDPDQPLPHQPITPYETGNTQ
ncbi:MAG: hypothetical protein R6X32_23585 [Chloroflexota bacterium]|jgi:hypothetical protein